MREIGAQLSHQKWESNLQNFVDFYAKHHHIPRDRSPESSSQRTAIWIINQRAAHRKGTLSADRISALDATGIDWKMSTRTTFEDHLEKLKIRLDGTDALRISDLTHPDDAPLKRWLTTLTRQSRMGTLSAHKHADLTSVMPGWDTVLDAQTPQAQPARGAVSKHKLISLLERYTATLSYAEEFDKGRTTPSLSPYTWLADHHTGSLGRLPSEAEVIELEQQFGLQFDVSIVFPLPARTTVGRTPRMKKQDLDWVESALALTAYRRRTGRFPRQVGNREEYRAAFHQERAKKHPREDLLAQEMSDDTISLRHWLSVQRDRDVRAMLREDRATFLDTILPEWRDRTRRRQFSDTATRVARFVTEHRHWPSNRAQADADEKFLADALKMWRVAERADRLAQDRSEAMRALFGDSWTSASIRPITPDPEAVQEVERRQLK